MIDYILHIFFPEHCQGCSLGNTALCDSCKDRLAPSKPITDIENAFAIYNYGDPIIRFSIWNLKYNRKSSLIRTVLLHGAPIIQEHFSNLLQKYDVQKIVLVPIPQHYSKTFSRGFNQSVLIAKWIKMIVPNTAIETLLKKNKATTSQAHTHTRSERQRNLQASMQVIHPEIIEKSTLYIVIDDVITTGSTVSEAGRALRAAGAVHIHAVAIAHGYKH